MFHKLAFIVCDKDGNPSTAKLWRHVAFGVITYKVALIDGMTYEMLLAYAAIVGGMELGQKLIHFKTQGRKTDGSK